MQISTLQGFCKLIICFILSLSKRSSEWHLTLDRLKLSSTHLAAPRLLWWKRDARSNTYGTHYARRARRRHDGQVDDPKQRASSRQGIVPTSGFLLPFRTVLAYCYSSLHSSGISISPSAMPCWMSRGDSPLTVHPMELQVPRISLTVPASFLAMERSLI